MADDQTPQAQGATGVFVPPAVRTSHGDLVDLILRSESMNDEERQYWVDILPVMTPEQVEQLRGILVNERDQLAAIDAKYSKEVLEEPKTERPLDQIGSERKERAQKLSSEEKEAENAEALTEEEILKQVQDL